MAFIEPMHRNKPNITYLLTAFADKSLGTNGIKFDMLMYILV